jgi:hypothetical protein
MATRRQADNRSGEFRVAESGPDGYSAFHPAPLPPDPAIDVNAELQALLDQANQALGRLDGITLLLPDPDQFLYSYVRKEAVLSSQIEGTQSSLSDLLLFEADAAPGVPVSDARSPPELGPRFRAGTGKVPAGTELDRRLSTVSRPIRPPALARGRTGDGSAREVPT